MMKNYKHYERTKAIIAQKQHAARKETGIQIRRKTNKLRLIIQFQSPIHLIIYKSMDDHTVGGPITVTAIING
jgi:hypothetical protein